MKSGKSVFVLLAFAVCLFTFIQSCKHEPIDIPQPSGSTTNGVNAYTGSYSDLVVGSSGDTIKDSVCFVEEILPIMLSNCAKPGCHVGGIVPPITNYSQVLNFVSPYNPSGSILYNYVSTNYMPRNNPPLTQVQKDLIKEWISEGAKNNIDCGMVCDTSVFTFSDEINITLQNYCIRCHNGSAAGAGISLIGYSNVLTQVNNGKLLGDINNYNGFNAMPPGSSMLEECRITQIKNWIAGGTPDN